VSRECLVCVPPSEDGPQVPERHNKLVAAVGSVIREEPAQHPKQQALKTARIDWRQRTRKEAAKARSKQQRTPGIPVDARRGNPRRRRPTATPITASPDMRL